jgi:hypothetical protein
MTETVEPRPEFRTLTEPQVMAALGDADSENRIACEVARLISGYTANFQEHVGRLGRIPSHFLRIKPRWPIEAVAMRLTIDALRDAVSESAQAADPGDR